MPTPFNIRKNLAKFLVRLLRKEAENLEGFSKEKLLDVANKELGESLLVMAGSQSEMIKIKDWIKQNPNDAEVKAFKGERSSLSFLILETLYAKIIRKYESENNLDKRSLGNQEIESILENGRHIRAIRRVDHDEFISYAYTVGNCTSLPPNPELLCFYPGSSTSGYVLNCLSEMFASELLKPLQSGEVTEVVGVLPTPIRLALLEDAKREYSVENWTFSIPKTADYPLVFVDIPDPNGYYLWESECDELIKKDYPEDYALKEATSTYTLPVEQSMLPASKDAACVCLRFHSNIARFAANKEDTDLSQGTHLTLVNMELWMDPDTWAQEENELITDNYHFLASCSYVKGIKQWVEDELFYRDNDPHEIAFDWWLPKPEENQQTQTRGIYLSGILFEYR